MNFFHLWISFSVSLDIVFHYMTLFLSNLLFLCLFLLILICSFFSECHMKSIIVWIVSHLWISFPVSLDFVSHYMTSFLSNLPFFCLFLLILICSFFSECHMKSIIVWIVSHLLSFFSLRYQFGFPYNNFIFLFSLRYQLASPYNRSK